MHFVGEVWVKNQMLRPEDWGRQAVLLLWKTPLLQHWVEGGAFSTQTEKFILSNCRHPHFRPWGRTGLVMLVSYHLKNEKDFTAWFIRFFHVPPLGWDAPHPGCVCSSPLIIKVWTTLSVVVSHLPFISHLLSDFLMKSGM